MRAGVVLCTPNTAGTVAVRSLRVGFAMLAALAGVVVVMLVVARNALDVSLLEANPSRTKALEAEMASLNENGNTIDLWS